MWPKINKCVFEKHNIKSHPHSDYGTSPVVQWLRLHAFIAGGMGSIPDWGTRILHAARCAKKKKKKKPNQMVIIMIQIKFAYGNRHIFFLLFSIYFLFFLRAYMFVWKETTSHQFSAMCWVLIIQVNLNITFLTIVVGSGMGRWTNWSPLTRAWWGVRVWDLELLQLFSYHTGRAWGLLRSPDRAWG